MIIIIPLGGTGERFKKNGYKKPKALINVFGKPILYYLLDSLNFKNVDFVCIPYNSEYSIYNFESTTKKNYPNIKFIFIELKENTKGAAETINIALQTINTDIDKPVLCLDGDNFYTTDVVNLWNCKNRIITFEDLNNSPIYSYLKIKDGQVRDIVEKQKISNYACTGAYGFDSIKKLLFYTQKIIDNKIKQKGEYYTSNVIKEMINDNIYFDSIQVNVNNYHCLGTPVQLKYFYNNYPKVSCVNNSENISKQRICFDLDNTLVSFPKIKDDYTTVEPIVKNIQFLKYIKTFGHTIIIYTARRMKTHKGNVGKSLSDIGKITFDTLEKFDIPFDEIYFGKPHADVYIDDLALNCCDNLQQELGYYMENISPRNHNKLELETVDVFKKISNDLSGEIYYYNNIPYVIKDLFPLLVDYDVNNKWYKIEKINGISLTSLYLSELLTENTLIHVMNSIQRLHNVDVTDYKNINLNIYENYVNKLNHRYNTYDYSKFKNHETIFNYLIENLTIYQNNNSGKCVIVHGDPVMTNIIINKFEKIKFIDMRGKLGNELTLCGDYLYDWAKLYQSLIGYDRILMNTIINKTYEKNMIDIFEKYFINLYSINELKNLKLITKSLLFSLIPLHDNDLCFKYFDLINIID